MLCGSTRFDELQSSLGIAPTVLTRRLNRLVDTGLLTRNQYQDRPVRFEYLPTEAALEFRPVLDELARWGRHWAGSRSR